MYMEHGQETRTQGCCFYGLSVRRGIHKVQWPNVHWDVDQFYKVSNETHDSKTNGDSLADLCKFLKNNWIMFCQVLE